MFGREREREKKRTPPQIFNPCGFTLFRVEKFIAELGKNRTHNRHEKRIHKYSKLKKQRKMLIKWMVVGLDLVNVST